MKNSYIHTLNGWVAIDLGQGISCLIDKEDLPLVSKHNWTYQHSGPGRYYARANHYGPLYMHKLICNHDQEHTDHINRNSLDNRRSNLRGVSASVNLSNRGGYSATGYKGVYLQRRTGRYETSYRGQHIGTFDTVEEAAKAYEKKTST